VVAATTGGQGHDGNWYTDSGATGHVIGDLEKLAISDKYTGDDQIHTRAVHVCTLVVLVLVILTPYVVNFN
jgi:hypothetical protein